MVCVFELFSCTFCFYIFPINALWCYMTRLSCLQFCFKRMKIVTLEVIMWPSMTKDEVCNDLKSDCTSFFPMTWTGNIHKYPNSLLDAKNVHEDARARPQRYLQWFGGEQLLTLVDAAKHSSFNTPVRLRGRYCAEKVLEAEYWSEKVHHRFEQVRKVTAFLKAD